MDKEDLDSIWNEYSWITVDHESPCGWCDKMTDKLDIDFGCPLCPDCLEPAWVGYWEAERGVIIKYGLMAEG